MHYAKKNVSRLVADEIFKLNLEFSYSLSERNKLIPRLTCWVYFMAVRIFGWAFWRLA